jgi:hypothetical protein
VLLFVSTVFPRFGFGSGNLFHTDGRPPQGKQTDTAVTQTRLLLHMGYSRLRTNPVPVLAEKSMILGRASQITFDMHVNASNIAVA